MSHRRAGAAAAGEAMAAQFGSLAPGVADDVRTLREFWLNRDRLLQRLYGCRLRRSLVRDELLRLILIGFAEQRPAQLADLQRACAELASEPTVRRELDLMAMSDLVVWIPAAHDSRHLVVLPTVKLVAFYNEQMPRLAAELARIVAARGLLVP